MERRQFPRVPLDVTFFVEVSFDGRGEVSALLVDIGRGGLQLAFPPHMQGMEDILGCQAVVRGLPVRPGRGAGREFSGAVSWISPERFGIRFLDPIPLSDAEITALALSL